MRSYHKKNFSSWRHHGFKTTNKTTKQQNQKETSTLQVLQTEIRLTKLCLSVSKPVEDRNKHQDFTKNSEHFFFFFFQVLFQQET